MQRWRERFDLMARYGFEANRASGSLVLMTVIAAVSVSLVGLLQEPKYEASAELLVSWQQGDEYWANMAGSSEQLQTLEYRGDPPTQAIMQAVASRSVAQETIQRLDLSMEPSELLGHLSIEQIEGTAFIRIRYEDTDPVRATQVANTVAEIASERSREFSATVWKKAAVPWHPVRPHPFRAGLLTLIVGLALSSGPIAPARASLAAAAGELGERVRAVVQEAAQAGVLRRQRRDRSIIERVNEKKLLQALGRCGRMSAVEASLATELSVDEADRILYELAYQGQLEFDIENGARVYSFWKADEA